ncbi:4-hydroxy-tetrahydrodipicolinate synthase [Bacteriovorax stolpii]|uniref:4-hydroxy-tetrahydrodipicolinate synthase n=1 Tax=Bacteriovorax stolpii TaxID=960 RepID=UPI0011576C6B|nr:4-hydroxy-tetrahydrodipicolinate synthase [Bacteriovorax stolpii]QDK41693.1 4-hydroxy-tetrahydrodipicolinate synthase [Bacteriovorax stolpii]
MKNLNDYPLWTAIVTPMNADSTVDYPTFEKILKQQEAANVAVVILGSTGEALNLNKDECKKILEFGLGLNLKVPVMTGIGGFNQKDTLEYVSYLNTLSGLDAYLVVTPLYAKPGEQGQTQWFKAILDLANKPCMLYNVPGRTGVKMNFNAIKNLKDHKNFWAIKEASGSVEDFKKYGESAPNARLYSGDDGMVPDFYPHRCVGLVSVASNAWPAPTRAYVEKTLAGKLSNTEADLWKKACDTLFIAANPVPVKNLMHAKGQIKTNVLRAPLHHLDLADNSPVLNADKNITTWFKEHN